MTYRDTASFGRRQEYVVVAELLKRGFDVYMTLVDDQGIDCIIRLDPGNYLDIQIKARSTTAKHWSLFAAMTIEPRDNYYFIFYTEKSDRFWTLCSTEVVAHGSTTKSGKHKGKVHLSLPTSDRGVKADRLAPYRDDAGFELLRSHNLRKRRANKK